MAKARKCSPAKVWGRRSSSRARRRKRAAQANLRSTTHCRGSSPKPFLADGSLTTSNDYFQTDTLLSSRCQRLVSGVAWGDESHLHALARHRLHLGGPFGHLCPILLAGWSDAQRHELAQGVDSHRHFAAFAPFGPIVVRSA